MHSQLRYNELGELAQKNLHSEDFQSVLQSSDYSYSIRGWLTGINEPGNLNRNKALFGMKLSYQDPDAGIGKVYLRQMIFVCKLFQDGVIGIVLSHFQIRSPVNTKKAKR